MNKILGKVVGGTTTTPIAISNMANALKGSASGNPLVLSDVSPIPHDMTVTEDVGGTDIVRSGKNLLDIYGRTAGGSLGAYTNTTKRAFEYDKYYVGLTVNNFYDKTSTTAELVDGVWNVTAKQSGYSVAFPIKALPNTRYSCSGVYNGTLSMALYDGEGVFIKTQPSSSSFVTPENCETIVVCLVPSGKNETYQFSNVQLEFGPAKTEYEPYVEPVSYYSSSGDVPIKITSLYPTTVLYGEHSLVVTAEYNRDINKVIANLENALLSLGGNS